MSFRSHLIDQGRDPRQSDIGGSRTEVVVRIDVGVEVTGLQQSYPMSLLGRLGLQRALDGKKYGQDGDGPRGETVQGSLIPRRPVVGQLEEARAAPSAFASVIDFALESRKLSSPNSRG